MTTDMLPPCSPESEDALLGSVLIDPDCMLELATFLTAEMFYVATNGQVYDAMLTLHTTQQPIDLITVPNLLRQRGHLDNQSSLFGLINTVPTAINAVHYGRIIQATYIRRATIRAAAKIGMLAYDETISLDEMIRQANDHLLALGSGEKRGPQHIKAVVSEYLDFLTKAENGDSPDCIPTGFKDLDRLLGGGMWRQDALWLAARPGMGKSAVTKDILLHAAKNGYKVFTAQLEMSSRSNLLRLVAGEIRLEYAVLRSGIIPPVSQAPLYESLGQLSQLPIWIDDNPSLSISDLQRLCQQQTMMHGLDLVVVDYGQLLDAPGRTEIEKLSQIGRGIAKLAKELNVAVLVTAQLNRNVEQRQDKRPHLSDIRGSGSLEQDADAVMFLYRDDYYNPDTSERPNVAELELAKHRNGATGTVDLYWHSKFATFRNLERQQINLSGPSLWENKAAYDASQSGWGGGA